MERKKITTNRLISGRILLHGCSVINNCQTCLHQRNQISDRLKNLLQPPSLSEYLTWMLYYSDVVSLRISDRIHRMSIWVPQISDISTSRLSFSVDSSGGVGKIVEVVTGPGRVVAIVVVDIAFSISFINPKASSSRWSKRSQFSCISFSLPVAHA